MDSHERRDALTRETFIFQSEGYEVDQYYGDYEVLMVKEPDINHALHAIGCLLFPVWMIVWFTISFRNDLRGPEYAHLYVDDYGVVSVKHSREPIRNRLFDLGLDVILLLIGIMLVLALIIVVLLPML